MTDQTEGSPSFDDMPDNSYLITGYDSAPADYSILSDGESTDGIGLGILFEGHRITNYQGIIPTEQIGIVIPPEGITGLILRLIAFLHYLESTEISTGHTDEFWHKAAQVPVARRAIRWLLLTHPVMQHAHASELDASERDAVARQLLRLATISTDTDTDRLDGSERAAERAAEPPIGLDLSDATACLCEALGARGHYEECRYWRPAAPDAGPTAPGVDQ